MVASTVTVARVSNRSIRERKSDVLLVVPDGDSQALLPGRHVFRSLPDPRGSFPVVRRLASDDMPNPWERKVIAHRHDPIGRDAV
jgi:hypothetical protein